MASDFGLKIGIEGEREFKSALKDINQQFKVLGSEMKLVESQFDKQDRSVSALTSRNEVLTRQINEQKDKIELLRRALENSAESFGENDQRTKQWTVQLNNAQAQLNNMERELKDNEKAIDGVGDEFQDAEKKADGFGDEVKQAANKADDANERFRKLGDTLKTIGRALAIGLVAIGTAAIAAGTALVNMTVDAAAYADENADPKQRHRHERGETAGIFLRRRVGRCIVGNADRLHGQKYPVHEQRFAGKREIFRCL